MTEDAPTRQQRRVGPFVYSPLKRAPRVRGDLFPAKAAGATGLGMAAAHDVVYRQTGGDDFVLDVVSHAGADMLFLVTVPIVAVLYVIGRR